MCVIPDCSEAGIVCSLRHVQELDYGSRGGLGALFVIPLAAKGNIPALIAATLSLISLSTGPFVQQAVRTVECSSPTAGTASIPYAHFVPRTGSYITEYNNPAVSYPDADTAIMIYSSQATPRSPENQLRVTCSTGNCTFPYGDPTESTDSELASHSTVALCHHCTDATPLLRTEGANTGRATMSLPNGHTITALFNNINCMTNSNLTWEADLLTPAISRLSQSALLNVTVAAYNHGPKDATAVTCVLYTCLRTYSSSIVENRFAGQELSSTPASEDLLSFAEPENWDYLDVTAPRHLTAVKSPCRVDGVVYSTRNFSLASNTTTLSFCEAPADGEGPCQGHCDDYRGFSCAGNASTVKWLTTLQNGGNTSITTSTVNFQNVDTYFDSFAVSISNRFRMTFGSSTYRVTPNGQVADGLPFGEVHGTAWQTSGCTYAQFRWLVLPTALAASTAALLAWMIARSWTRRYIQPVWKEDLLPLILYKERLLSEDRTTSKISGDLEDARNSDISEKPLMEINQMSRLASQIPVRFQWTNVGNEEPQDLGVRRRRVRDT
ncbi:uncharacterized protein BCR38DRAFT_412436 [Pseudomassariella vexata]|uniref:Uncharacterized protein n=1 Tax=Pseudomassariella vexata TaxID=1141098 RepID=A0A1Y2DM86_9PEZI|nr:uncharacterized protein BCR38DRAFT_412436 [Pseudomassariella vexata]ORY60259.1 hypothetical protein BCR38DRAFT_412436 [Pseudomassariella vexata]